MNSTLKAITPEQAAKKLGVSAQYVQIRMQRNLFNPPIGIADWLPGHERWCYKIFPQMLADNMKVSVEEIIKT